MVAEYLGNSVVFREIGPISDCVGDTDVVKYFIIHKVRNVKVFSLFLDLGENGC